MSKFGTANGTRQASTTPVPVTGLGSAIAVSGKSGGNTCALLGGG